MKKITREFGSRVPKNFSSSLSPIGVADLFGKDISDPSEAIKDWYQVYFDYSKITGKFGSRVPDYFSSSESPELIVADLWGDDISDPSDVRSDIYNGYWYYPKENDINLSLKSGSGKQYFLSYSDQAIYTDDKIDIYFDILDYNPNEDFLILPFLTSDKVEITQENNFIIADLGSGKKDKIFKLSEKPWQVMLALQINSIVLICYSTETFNSAKLAPTTLPKTTA